MTDYYETEIQVEALRTFLENLKLISPEVYKLYCNTDFVELRKCKNKLDQNKE